MAAAAMMATSTPPFGMTIVVDSGPLPSLRTNFAIASGTPPSATMLLVVPSSLIVNGAGSSSLQKKKRSWALSKSPLVGIVDEFRTPQRCWRKTCWTVEEEDEGKNFRIGCRASSTGEAAAAAPEPLKVMIAGAPASGKGTQCELIVEKFGLTHISAGDLLRAEVALGTPAGLVAKEFMDAGKLVPREIVALMVTNRLAKPDASARGWLLDGYPRSLEQAEALESAGIRPKVFILLDVPDEKLVARVVGRRQDPVTGKIYHLTSFPPESEEIARRLVQRSDDREEKVKARVETHHANVDAVLGVYRDVVKVVDGDRSKRDVFGDIVSLLTTLQAEHSPIP